jgi:hypothetical protein
VNLNLTRSGEAQEVCMSLRRSAGTLAVALTLSAGSAAPAVAKFDNTTFPPYTPQPGLFHHTSPGPEWPLIGIAGVAGVAVLGAGAVATRRRAQSAATVGGQASIRS